MFQKLEIKITTFRLWFRVFSCLRVESKGKRLWEGEHLSWIQEAGEPWVRMNAGFYENPLLGPTTR